MRLPAVHCTGSPGDHDIPDNRPDTVTVIPRSKADADKFVDRSGTAVNEVCIFTASRFESGPNFTANCGICISARAFRDNAAKSTGGGGAAAAAGVVQ